MKIIVTILDVLLGSKLLHLNMPGSTAPYLLVAVDAIPMLYDCHSLRLRKNIRFPREWFSANQKQFTLSSNLPLWQNLILKNLQCQ